MNKKTAGGLIGTVLALIIIFLIVRPMIVSVTEKANMEAAAGAIRNAYTAYLYQDTDHVAHPKTLKIVFDGYLFTITDNDIQDAEGEHIGESLKSVTIGSKLTSGTYEEGVYVSDESGYMLVKHLNPGDSLTGLNKAEIPENDELSGYTFYGHMEKCDVYVKN